MINNKEKVINYNIKKNINNRYNNGICIEQYDGKFICNNKRESNEDLCKYHIRKQFNMRDCDDFNFTFDFSIKNNININ